MHRLILFLTLILLIASGVVADGAAPRAIDQATTRDSAPDSSQAVLTEIASGFDRPLFVTNAGDDRLFILEQSGLIKIWQGGALLPTPFLDVSQLISTDVFGGGYTERGLLGLAFHPNYAQNRQFYINYTNRSNNGTVVARYLTSPDDPNVALPASAETIFTHSQPFANHNGGHLEFGPDGYLYISMGDGGSGGDPMENGQNPATVLGAILRIDVDSASPYAIPADNPAATVNPDLAPEIWAWGLRNVWRFSFDSATGDLYIADVGQNAWEEVNFEPAGSPGGVNYGWNIFEGTHQYSGAPDPGGLTLPIFEYDRGQGQSITGGYVYRGAALPSYDGAYFFGDFGSGNIWSSWRDASGAWQTGVFMFTRNNISSFGVDVNGELLVVNYSGSVLRLDPAS
jgi:glucose/arabinose dehydrogenase